MKRKTKNIIALFLLLLCFGAVQAQVDDKGVTSTGKEIDCFTISPEDRVVNEYGAIVTQPRLTRNGKIITDDCCPTLVDTSLTDTVTCVSISMAATIQKGTFKTGILQVFSDANYSTSVGEFAASVTDNKITAKATGLTCYTHYYFKLILNGQCEYVWTDSTRDATLEKPTYCTVANIRTTTSGLDMSHEHKYNNSDTQIDSVYDHQGNRYAVVQIGNQCWLKENMRATTLPSGNTMTLKSVDGGSASEKDGPRRFVNNATNKGCPDYYEKYGCLYNWIACMDKTKSANSQKISISHPHRGICPAGWHVPQSSEWNELGSYTLEDNHYGVDESFTGQCMHGTHTYSACNTHIAPMLAGGCDWISQTNDKNPGYYGDYRNATGLSILPAGYWNDGNFSLLGKSCRFWTSTQSDENAQIRYLDCENTGMGKGTSAKYTYGRSVRCLRNPQYAVYPNVDTVSCTSMNITAQVIGLGTLTIKTVCAYTDESCTTGQICATSVTANATNDTISATITGLSCNTRYYIKVTATDGTHPVEAVITDSTRDMTLEKATFCTVASARALVEGSDQSHEHLVEGSTTEIDSVYDHQGNRYAVVQIGNQCWLKQNMRATTSPSTGSRILMNVVISYSSKSACWHHNDSTTYSKYGVLYNWCAAVDTFYNDGHASHPELANATGHSSVKTWTCVLPAGNRRGVCPQGWHLPTDDEWTALTTSAGVGVESGGTGLGKLAGGCDWPENTTVATCPGNYTYAERNSTGFSALPVGSFNNVGFDNVGSFAYFWSATQHENDQSAAVYGRYLAPGSGYMLRNANVKANGYSVRCVRNVPDTITFISNNGVNDTVIQLAMRGDSTLLRSNSFTNGEIKFANWNTEAAGCGTTYNNNDTVITSGSLTLYAQWNNTYCKGNPLLNEVGDAESNQIFSVEDHEGNSYKVVELNGICVTKQNMRCTTTPRGVTLNNSSANSYEDYHYYAHPSFASEGYVYCWKATMDLDNSVNTNSASFSHAVDTFINHRGICPEGWHVPRESEYDALFAGYDAGQLTTNENCALVPWENSNVANSPGDSGDSDKNSSGFSAIAVGRTDQQADRYGQYAYFQTATVRGRHEQVSNVNALVEFYYNNDRQDWDDIGGMMNHCFSVRCMRNSYTVSFDRNGGVGTKSDMQVSIGEIVSLANNSAYTHPGNFTFAGWNTKRDGSGTAYADGAEVTITENVKLYAQWISWCPGIATDNEHPLSDNQIDSVFDHQGHKYAVVSINGRCVMKQNLRVTESQITGSLVNTSSASTTESRYFKNEVYGNEGYLYNWRAAMDLSVDVSGIGKVDTFDNHRGLCPVGWHLPKKSEWDIITNGYNAGQFAAYNDAFEGDDWSSSTGNKPGNPNYEEKNITGFSAVPVGNITSGGLYNKGDLDYYSSATSISGSQSYILGVDATNSSFTDGGGGNKNSMFSIRCIRNEYMVKFDANGGSGALDSIAVGFSSNTVRLPQNTSIVHSGNFDFKGWNTDRFGRGTSYDDQDEITVNGNVTLYAQWHSYCDGHYNSANEQGTASRVDSVKDIDLNWYQVVQIGNQCWLAENMRATRFPNGDNISKTNFSTHNETTAYRFSPNGDDGNVAVYGYLYNWPATMQDLNASSSANPSGIQGICPDGWHVPSDAEWTVMEQSVAPSATNLSSTGYRAKTTDIAVRLSSAYGWTSDNTANTAGDVNNANRNASGFSILPAGTDENFGEEAWFWTSTSASSTHGYYRQLNNSSNGVNRNSDGAKWRSRSVRCVRNEYNLSFDLNSGEGTIEPIHVSAGNNTFNLPPIIDRSGNFEFAGWNTDRFGLGTAYADQEEITIERDMTLYAQWHSYCDGNYNSTNEQGTTNRVDSVKDIDQNWYKVVQIGDQCWLAENMRATKFSDARELERRTSSPSGVSLQYYFYPGNDINNVNKYGLLYSWAAAMNGAESSDAVPSNIQGICPTGWHLPSNAEWIVMETVVAPNAEDLSNDNGFRAHNTDIAARLSSYDGWTGNNIANSAADLNNANRNKSGFSALPAGYSNSSYFCGTKAYFWTSTEIDASYAYFRYLDSSNTGISNVKNANKELARSVRCVRN